jgi:Lipoprotein NlpI, contains TPR repeats
MGIAPGRTRGLGDLDRAIADFDQSLALDASNANDFNGRGVIYLDKKQYARAIEDFDQAIRLDPEQALALSNRCWSKVLAGAHDAAGARGLQ